VEQEEQLMLPLGEMADRWQQDRDITRVLPAHDRGRMLARRGQMDTVSRAVDFDQTLGTATNGADAAAEGRAVAPRLPLLAERTLHELSFA
jgi:hypothetical protein